MTAEGRGVKSAPVRSSWFGAQETRGEKKRRLVSHVRMWSQVRAMLLPGPGERGKIDL